MKNIKILLIFMIIMPCLLNGQVVKKTGFPQNVDDVRSFIYFPDSVLERLYNEGMVVLGKNQHYSLSDPSPIDSGGYGFELEIMEPQGYAPFSIEVTHPESGVVNYIKTPLMQNVSVVVTADSCLWLFHMIFDDMLKYTEIYYLNNDLKTFVSVLRQNALAKFDSLTTETQPVILEAYKQTAIFSLVADKLLNKDVSISDAFSTDVLKIVGLIENPPDNFRCYPEEYDWSNFKPRGHYSGDEQLERYFRAVKWISMRAWQINILSKFKGDVEPPESFKRHKEETIAAAWISKMIMENPVLNETWSRMYNLTALLAGFADSITPVNAYQAFKNVLGENYDPDRLADPNLLNASIDEFNKNIYPESKIGLGCCMALEGKICGYPNKYFQLMGERYFVDSELFQQIGDDEDYIQTPKPLVIHGLDVAAGVLGSVTARDILQGMDAPELQKHTMPFLENLNKTWTEEDWTSTSVYNGWLHSLRGLVQHVPYDAPAPEFTHTVAYTHKQVMTALASWTHLRRDFILYGKQSASGTICLGGFGIVEPCPELYKRLASLCELTDKYFKQYNINLNNIELPPPDYSNYWGPIRPSSRIINLTTALKDLKEQLYEFEKCANKEIQGIALTCDEQNNIHLFGSWLFNEYFNNIYEKLPAQIADVHTDNMSGILEEATGWFNPALYLYKQPGGPSLIGVGFVMSQYEFWTGDFNRMTDAEWQEELGKPDKKFYPRASWQEYFTSFSDLKTGPSDNDLCANAKAISIPYESAATNLYYNTPTTAIDNAPDAWWLLTSPAQAASLDIIAQGGSGPVDIAIYKGSCSNLTLIKSSSSFSGSYQTRINFISEGNNAQYYIRAASAKLPVGYYNTKNIELTVKKAEASANNTCSNAYVINNFPKIDISTTLISNTIDRPFSDYDYNQSWADAFWLLPKTPECGSVIISTKDSRVPASVFVYEGTCNDLKLIAHKNYNGTDPKAGISLSISGDKAMAKNHYIVISGDAGPVVLNIELVPSVNSIIDLIINRNSGSPDADINGDGKIDIADIIALINKKY